MITYLLGSICLFSQTSSNELFNDSFIYQLIFKSYDIDQEKYIFTDIEEGIGGIQLMWGNHNFEDTRNLTTKIYEKSKNNPPFIAIDYEGGTVYLHQTHGLLNLPSNMAIAKSSDIKNTSVLFYLIGLELKKAGINTIFAPTIDVNTNPKNPIINIRSFSNNPLIVFNFSKAVYEGLSASGIITTLKHFPGHGMVDKDSHLVLPQTSIEPIELYEIHIKPFKNMILEDKADIIMTSHILYKLIDSNNPASMSKIFMKDILRKQLGFKGLIITDSLDMKAISSNYSVEDAAVISLKNGSDMVLIGRYNSQKVVNRIKKAIKNKELTIKDILEKNIRIKNFKEKHKLKNFYSYKDDFDIAYKKIAQEISLKSITSPKCSKIDKIINTKKLDILFIIPQRYLKDILIIYSEIKKLNSSAIMYTNINELKKHKIQDSYIIIASYFWPYIKDEKIKEIKKLLNYYDHSLYINMLNPYDSTFFIEDFDCIIETYGINEFSSKAAIYYIKKLLKLN
ncbi:MAG: hypothetical protein N2Z20_04460 [Elusimicrobiales bacterium]|nr:hypothetical protein [Elusimicrobiales bacterium]